jgi:N,N'-diacetyllegionaminate synthase
VAAVSGRTLFLIPARGGSRRFPRKNLQHLAGIPLVGWAARIARAASSPGDLVVCSTDDAEIAAAATSWGASILDRPANLATDDATSLAVAVHALDALAGVGSGIDLLVLVQPTGPLTDPVALRGAIDLARRTGRSVTSVTAADPAAWRYRRDEDGSLQALAAAGTTADDAGHQLTGGFYVTTPEALRATGTFVEPGVTIGFVVPADRAVDIDVPDDLDVAAAHLRARPVAPFRIGEREVGADGPFVIAEAGVNHDGELELAHRLIDAAVDAGAGAVKFQTFVPEALASADAPTAAYQRERDGGDDQRAMLARLALPPDAWASLQAHAAERGILFLSTPFDDASADLLDRLDVPAFKVGSGELTNLPFLERLARRDRPLIVSTGMATMVEVAQAVDTIRAADASAFALLHCVSAYPASPEDANLAAMRTMREAFGVQTGWSDHTPGIELPIAAAALGAAIVEKHLTLDRSRRGPDHAMSLEPAEFAAMVAAIDVADRAVGSGDKRPSPAEAEIAAVARRSLHWATDLPAGTTIEAGHLVAQRPGTGMSPARSAELVGRVTARAVHADALVDGADT